jgi:hypothetical protein
MMKLHHPRVGLLVLVTAVMLSWPGVSQSLNPLVTRNPQATVAVPANCNESLAPAPAPRVDIAEIPLPEIEPAEAPAPPSGSLRAALQNAQAALARNDRPEFDRALASARTLLATYPTGAERRTGEELVRIYDAAARLWDAQYQSPFFGEGSPEFAAVSGYPGYRDAVRRSTITVNEQRLYPAAESRDFLGRVAADRLRGIGIQAPTRVARAEAGRRAPASTSVAPSPSRSGASSAPRASSSPRRMPRQPRSSAPSRPRLSSPSSSPTQVQTPAAVTSTPGTSPNLPAPPATAAAPAPATPMAGTAAPDPVAASPAEESPTEDVPAEPGFDTDTDVGTDTGTAPAVATTAAVETPPAPPAPAATTPSRTRSVLLPTILILIGLGVLIVLFRASK